MSVVFRLFILFILTTVLSNGVNAQSCMDDQIGTVYCAPPEGEQWLIQSVQLNVAPDSV